MDAYGRADLPALPDRRCRRRLPPPAMIVVAPPLAKPDRPPITESSMAEPNRAKK